MIALRSQQEPDDEEEEDAEEDEAFDTNAEAAGGDGDGGSSSDEDAKPWGDGSSDDVNRQIMRDLPAFTPEAQAKAPQYYSLLHLFLHGHSKMQVVTWSRGAMAVGPTGR